MREIFISASLHIHILTKFPPCFCPFVSLVFCSLFSLPLFYFLSFQTPSLSDPHPLFLSFPSNFFHFHFPSQFPQTLHNSPANCFFFFFFLFLTKPSNPIAPTRLDRSWTGLSMSGLQAPNRSPQPQMGQIMQQPLRRQLPFSSLKPPFAAPADYHRFSDPRRGGAADHDVEAEAIVVKPLVSFSRLY